MSSTPSRSINTITDTLGRVITFSYYADGNLQKITAQGREYGFTFSAYTLNYNFSGITVKDTAITSGTSVPVLTACTYPNGTKYSFGYGDWGIVNSIQYKSNTGQVRSGQSYDFPPYTTAQSDSPMFTQQTIFDGINTAVTNYSYTKVGGLISTVSVTDPTTLNGPQKKTVTTLSTAADFTRGLVTQTEIIDVTNNNKSMRKSVNVWSNNTAGPRLTSATNTNDASQQSKVTYTYDANGNVATLSEFDYGLALVRTTATTYLTSGNYPAQHILDRPTQVLVKDAAGNVTSRTDFAYDAPTLASVTGLTTHDDTNYPATFLTRGNVTRVTKYSNASAASGIIERNFSYDMLGNLLTADLDCCNKKTWTFDANTSYAFPSSITRGSSPGPTLTTSATYDSLYRLATSTDENGQSVSYTYDDANHTDRVVTVTRNSDGATFTTTYDDSSLHPLTTASSSVNSAVQKNFVDSSGRVRRDLYNGATLVSSVVSYVDALGRTYKVSNPFGANGTEIYTTTTFDALNRPVTITAPSGGSSQVAYTGNATQVTDPAGKTRKNFSDAFGRLVRVDEPGWGDGLPSHATVTVTGAEQNYGHWTVCNAKCIELGGESVFIVDGYDAGTVTLTINGSASTTVAYGQNSTPTNVATALMIAINNDANQLVQAASSGANITLTSKDKDASANYPLTASVVYDTVHETHASFGVILPNPANMTGATDATNHAGNPSLSTPMSTGYVYDALNNLTLVDQPPQTRTYVYDSLGRVTSVKTPETNQIATRFTYDDPGSGQVLTRTDPRSVVTTYGYDGLNRLATVAYSDGTPGVSYTYGSSSASSNNGRLISATDSSGTPAWSTIYGYNNLGQVTGVTKTISGAIYNIGYSYNADGTLKDVTYPSGRKVTQTYDAIGRLQTIADTTNNYMTITPTSDYNAAGQLTHFVYGNGVNANFGYNEHLQLASIRYSKSGQPDLLNSAYGYGTIGNNGQIATITDNVDSSHNMAYTYDAWSRLSTATAGVAPGVRWQLGFYYDRFGNKKQQIQLQGSDPTPQPQVTVDPNTNRIIISGRTYDANGNVTADPFPATHSYGYDAENRMKSVDGSANSYSYDDGVRIKKVTAAMTTVYVYSGTKVIAEYSGTSTLALSKEYVYSGSKLLATLTPNGSQSTVVYSHPDHLSGRVETDSTGTVARSFGQFPFGEAWYETGTASKWKFTTYERDAESGADYALARHYSSTYGVFMSPDPLGGNMLRPQSLDRYAYVSNDPLNTIDPTGLTALCTGEYGYVFFCDNDTQFGDGGEEGFLGGPLGEHGHREPGDCPFGTIVCDTVDQVKKILQETNCLKAVTGKDSPSAELSKNIDKALSNITTSREQSKAGPNGQHIDAYTTQGKLGALIVINTFGGFYEATMPSEDNSKSIQLYVGSYQGNTAGARDLTILHEVAHQFGAIPSDSGTKGKPDYEQSNKNTSAIEKACGSAIDSATGVKQ